jgi:hypothetical protein
MKQKLPNRLKKIVRDPQGPFYKRVTKDKTKYTRKNKHKQMNEEPLMVAAALVGGAAMVELIGQLVDVAKKIKEKNENRP